VKVSSRGGAAFGSVDADLDQNVMALKKEIQARLKPKTQPCRQRLEIAGRDQPVVLDDLTPLSEYINENQEMVEVIFKDLGPQIAFRPVYICEYLGPWLLYIPFALKLIPVYGKKAATPLNINQQAAFLLWMVHYTKRLLETLFVHEFDR